MANVKICLDAGHVGKYNAGVVSGYYESEIVWKLTNYEKKELLKYSGVSVILTRSDINKECEQIIENGYKHDVLESRGLKSKGCVYFESNHSNAAGTKDPRYATVIYLADDKSTQIDEKSKILADKMGKAVADCMGVTYTAWTKKADGWDRDGNGKYDDEWYGVLQGCKKAGTPGIIMEHSFHTNPDTCKWLMNDDNLKKLAKAKAKVWADLLGLKLKTTATTAKKETAVKQVIASVSPNNRNTEYRGAWKVTSDTLNVRQGPGTGYASMAKLKAGDKVQCYEQYRLSASGYVWLYVVAIVDKIEYTGFVRKKHVQKV